LVYQINFPVLTETFKQYFYITSKYTLLHELSLQAFLQNLLVRRTFLLRALILSETLALYKSFTYLLTYLLTRESSHCFQRVLVIAILSVCLSHGWISQKRCKLGLPNFQRRLPGKL